MTFDIPVRNEDGTVKCTMTMTPEQAQVILQFGLNFLVATGLSATYGIQPPEDEVPAELND